MDHCLGQGVFNPAHWRSTESHMEIGILTAPPPPPPPPVSKGLSVCAYPHLPPYPMSGDVL